MLNRKNPTFSELFYEREEPKTLGTSQSQIYPRTIFADYLPLETKEIERGNRWIYQSRKLLPEELKKLRMQDLFIKISLGRYADNTVLWVLTLGPTGPRLGSGMFVCSWRSPKRNDPEKGYYEDYTVSLSLQGFGIYPAILKLMRQISGPLRSDISLSKEAVKAWQRAGGLWRNNRFFLL